MANLLFFPELAVYKLLLSISGMILKVYITYEFYNGIGGKEHILIKSAQHSELDFNFRIQKTTHAYRHTQKIYPPCITQLCSTALQV